MNDTTARRLVVLAQVVPPLLERLEEPEAAVQRVRANMVELMPETLRERRELLGGFAFFSTI